jgi:hypothetical protein
LPAGLKNRTGKGGLNQELRMINEKLNLLQGSPITTLYLFNP